MELNRIIFLNMHFKFALKTPHVLKVSRRASEIYKKPQVSKVWISPQKMVKFYKLKMKAIPQETYISHSAPIRKTNIEWATNPMKIRSVRSLEFTSKKMAKSYKIINKSNISEHTHTCTTNPLIKQ